MTSTPLPAERTGDRPPGWRIPVGLGVVYLVWGSTYTAIRLAIDTLPPLLMVGVRFLAAGILLLAWVVVRSRFRTPRPSRRQLGGAGVIGGILVVGGNGGVSWAEQSVPTGTVALLVATIPLLMALFDRLLYRHRLPPRTVVGLGIGFLGVVGLVGLPHGHVPTTGAVVAVLAATVWSLASLASRRVPSASPPLLATALQMLTGGALAVLAAGVGGEWQRFDPGAVSLASLLALGYLVVFGSLIAFSTYLWLLRVAPASLVSTYAFANPVVAVLLGWTVLGERLTAAMAVAGSVILVGVLVILAARGARAPSSDAPATLGRFRSNRPTRYASEGI